VINSALRRAISENRPTAELAALAGENYHNMRQDGLERAAEGVTTIEEVLRATQDAEE
jgi:type II secretory ATPase GspE/PulE/Tfp pilus assembly ATPase PilB-like protein